MRVFVTRELPAATLQGVREIAEVEVWPEEMPPPREVLKAKAAEVEGLLCLLTDKIDAELLDGAPQLKVVSQMAVGYDNIDVKACMARGVLVGNTPGVLTETTADLAFALLLATARNLIAAEHYTRSGEWRTWSPMLLTGPDVHHATLGIVGMGRIGYEMARRAHGFQMKIVYTGRRPHPAADRDFGAHHVDLDTLLATSDFVSLHLPFNASTRHFIGATELQKMKPSALLINTARGGVVDQAALIAALQVGVIAGAGLDVFEIEPLPLDDPLLQLPNVTLLPHIGSASTVTRTRMAELASENLICGLLGKPLPHPVTA